MLKLNGLNSCLEVARIGIRGCAMSWHSRIWWDLLDLVSSVWKPLEGARQKMAHVLHKVPLIAYRNSTYFGHILTDLILG